MTVKSQEATVGVLNDTKRNDVDEDPLNRDGKRLCEAVGQ